MQFAYKKLYIYINFSPLRYNDPIPRPPPIWIPYDMQLKQVFANGKKRDFESRGYSCISPHPKKKKKKSYFAQWG